MKLLENNSSGTETTVYLFPEILGDFISDMLKDRIQYRCLAKDSAKAPAAKEFLKVIKESLRCIN